MAENKKSFLLYTDIIHVINKLDNEKAGQLFKHILSYVNDEDPHTDDLLLQLVFEPIKQSLKRDLLKYEKIREKKRLAGIASANARKQKQQVLTDVESVQQKPTHSTVSDNVSVSDSVDTNVSNKKENNKRKAVRFSPPLLEEVQSYCEERENTVRADTFINFYESKGWMVGRNKMKDWKAAVRNWEKKENFISHEKRVSKTSSTGSRKEREEEVSTLIAAKISSSNKE